MICITTMKRFCCEDISRIENYELAAADQTQTWHCHHRREISEQKSRKQLIAEGLYWKQPAEELILLTPAEHLRLHSQGKHLSSETLAKRSAALTGRKHSAATRAKISATVSAAMKGDKNPMFGKHRSAASRAKQSDSLKGRHYFTNGLQNKRCNDCPPGFWPGRTFNRS